MFVEHHNIISKASTINQKFANRSCSSNQLSWLELSNHDSLSVRVLKQINLVDHYLTRRVQRAKKQNFFVFVRKQSLCPIFRQTTLNVLTVDTFLMMTFPSEWKSSFFTSGSVLKVQCIDRRQLFSFVCIIKIIIIMIAVLSNK